MKKKYSLLVASGLLAISMLGACGSTDDFEEEYPADEPIMEEENDM